MSAIESRNASTTWTVQGRTALILCAAAALLEGFDSQSMGVAAPMLFKEFAIAPSQGGVIFSAATLGLFFGAAIGGRTADYLGRKQFLTGSLLLFGVCSLLTSLVHTTQLIIVMRVLTGLGLGGAMPNLIAIASEAIDAKRRVSAVTLVMAALPLGGALAGVLALAGLLGWGWRWIFVVGGLAPILVALVMLRIFFRRIAGSQSEVYEHVPLRARPVDRVRTALWGANRAYTTLLLWTGSFFTNLVLFLMLNWLPSLIVGLGFSRAEASVASIGFNLAGGVGAASLGRLHAGEHRRLWVIITYSGIAAALLALAAVASFGKAFLVAMLACALAGVFIIGAQLILYGLAPLYYQRANRATGVGAAIAVGRLGSVLGPLFAATVLVAGGASVTVLAGTVPFVVFAGSAVMALTRRPQSSE
jgi:MFS transporter, AAHS family, 3-hydroxyphenylpropionic acid transporter